MFKMNSNFIKGALFLSLGTLIACGGSEKPAEDTTTEAPKVETPAEPVVEPWVAPAESKDLKSPIASSKESIAKGAKHFATYCVSCHGESAMGDTPAGQAVKAANLVEKMPTQTNGEVFWKLTNGRNAMLKITTYGLTENDGWDLVNYLRDFTSKK